MPLSLSPSLVMSLLSEQRIAALEAALAEERARVAKLTAERDLLLAAHERLRLELELLRRRIFVAKAERVDTTQLELEFKSKLAELDKLGGAPAPGGESPGDVACPNQDGDEAAGPKGPTKKPTGRRDLRKAPLEEERVEIKDPLFEALVAEGKATRIGHEESSKLAWKRGGLRRLVVARVKYRAEDATGEAQIETAPMPAECFPRSLAAPSLVAKIIVDKYCDGLPLHRIEDRFARWLPRRSRHDVPVGRGCGGDRGGDGARRRAPGGDAHRLLHSHRSHGRARAARALGRQGQAGSESVQARSLLRAARR
jgi:transposase